MADDGAFALSNALDELYASPTADFTARRTQLAQRAKRAGDAEAAATLRGSRKPTTALRDDVVATLQAAFADPEVAARLGRLTTAEQWSGFGEFGVVTAKVAPDPELARARADVAAAERARADAVEAGRQAAREAGERLDEARTRLAQQEAAARQ